jgi:hypothetical protein
MTAPAAYIRNHFRSGIYLAKHKNMQCHETNDGIHTGEDVYGSGGIAPSILSLGTKWKCKLGFTLRPVFPRWNWPRYPFYKRVGGPLSRLGGSVEEKKFLSVPAIESESPSPYSSHNIDWATSVLKNWIKFSKYKSNCIQNVDRMQ